MSATIKSKFKSKKLKVRVKSKNFTTFKFLLVVFTFSFLLFPFVCYAAPCYGTKMPEKNKFFAGAQYYNIFQRYLDHSDNGKMRSQQEFVLLSYGVFDWLAIDLKGGVGNIKQHPEGKDELDYSPFMAGGYGFRLKVFDKDKIKGVCGFQHISVHPKTVHIANGKNKAVLDDWQFSALASYDFKVATVYLGGRLSRCDYIHWIDGSRSRVKSDLGKSYGLIWGTDIPLTQRIWLNLEGQALDSQALAVSLNYSF